MIIAVFFNVKLIIDLGFYITFSNKMKQDIFWRKYKMSLNYVVPENNEVLVAVSVD